MPLADASPRDGQSRQPQQRLRKAKSPSHGDLRRLRQSGKLSTTVGQAVSTPLGVRQIMPGHSDPAQRTIYERKLGTREEALGSHPPITRQLPHKTQTLTDKLKKTVVVQVRDSKEGRQHSTDSPCAPTKSLGGCIQQRGGNSTMGIDKVKKGQKRVRLMALDLLNQESVWNYRVRPGFRSLDEEAADVIYAALKNLRYKIEWYEQEYEGCLERFKQAHEAPWARDAMRRAASRYPEKEKATGNEIQGESSREP